MFHKLHTPRSPLPLLALLLACLLCAPAVPAESPPSFVSAIVTITLDTTPAWGSVDDIATDRIVLTPSTGQVLRAKLHAGSGRVLESETYAAQPERVALLAEATLPGLLAWPAWDGSHALDGWYTHLTVHFEGGYSMRFGGHVADEIGPEAFRDACAAIRALLEDAKAAAEP